MPEIKNASPTRADASRLCVLVIDDSDVDREVMAELLEKGGCVVHALPSPIGATRSARELKATVAVIDQNLPAMDGAKLVGLFRSNANLKHMRIILVSSAEESEMIDVAKRSQADGFVSKKRLREDLVRVVRGMTP